MSRLLKLSLVAAFVVSLLFFLANFPIVGHDAYFHLTNLDQYITLRSEGISIPRWTPNNFRGFGSATFYFYPPMVSLFGSVVATVLQGTPVPFVLNVLTFLMMVLAFATFRWYLRITGMDAERSTWSAMLYVATPYAFYDSIIRSAFAEYYAFAWLPLLLVALEWCIDSKDRPSKLRIVILSAIGWTLLCLTSIPITALALFVLPFWILGRFPLRDLKTLIPFLIGSLLAVLCLSFYLLPIFHFRPFVHLSHVFAFDSSRPFEEFWLTQLFTKGHGAEQTIQLIMFPLALALAVFWIRQYRRGSKSRVALSWIVVTMLTLLMQLPIVAAPIKAVIPILDYVQFPVRFYLFLSAALAVWVASGSGRTRDLVALLIALATLVTAAYTYHHDRLLTQYSIEKQINWNAFEYAPIETMNDTAKVRIFTNDHRYDPEVTLPARTSLQDTLAVVQRLGVRDSLLVGLAAPQLAVFHRFYWPEWRLTIAGTDLALPLFAAPDARLAAQLPSGHYSLILSMTRSESEIWGDRLSLVGFGVLTLLCLAGMRDRKPAAK